MQDIEIRVVLNERQAFEYAQFLKRATFEDYRTRARSDDEAYVMIAAGEQIREALAEQGFAPR